MIFTVSHAQDAPRPFWYQLETYADEQKAIQRARNYAIDHAGYVCVQDSSGRIVFGTDPVALDKHKLSY